MEYKLFDKPQYHDEKWYLNREAADHIHQEGTGHPMRLYEAISLVEHVFDCEDVETTQVSRTVADWGSGNGGLLSELKRRHPKLGLWGYDLCPANVKEAQEKYGLDVKLTNIVTGCPLMPQAAEIVVLTELLEHLVNPQELLRLICEARYSYDGPAATVTGLPRWIVASTPGFEDFQNHYEYHLWAWSGESFARMFERAGWIVKRHYHVAACGTQFLLAMNAELQ